MNSIALKPIGVFVDVVSSITVDVGWFDSFKDTSDEIGSDAIGTRTGIGYGTGWAAGHGDAQGCGLESAGCCCCWWFATISPCCTGGLYHFRWILS